MWLLLVLAVGAVAPTESRVRLSIREAGKPTGIRLRVTDGAGIYFAPLGHQPIAERNHKTPGDLLLGDGPFELHAYVYDGAEIDLPPGRYLFAARKGFEYEPIEQKVEIGHKAGQVVTLALRKFVDLERAGWFPGDTHLHFPDPVATRYEMECEGLRVCSLLLLKSGVPKPPRPGDGTFQNVELFTGKLAAGSDARHFIKVGEEFRHGLLAHLIFQNLKQIVWPVSTGGLRESGVGGYDWPMMLQAADEARAQRALVTWAHWPYPSMEAPLDIALGRIDSIDLLTVGNPFEHHPELVEVYKMRGPRAYATPPIEMYYHYLNCGLRLALSSGSDKMNQNPPMGSARTYVKTRAPLSYDSWVEGIRKGRTFVSTYPLLEFSVGGKIAGDTVTAGKLRVKARARSIEPYETLEVVVNGKVVASAAPEGRYNEAALDRTFEVAGGWIAVRAHGPKMLPYGATWWKMPVFAHSGPIYVRGRAPAAPESAAILLEQLGYLETWVRDKANFPAPENRVQALGYITQARAVYDKAAANH